MNMCVVSIHKTETYHKLQAYRYLSDGNGWCNGGAMKQKAIQVIVGLKAVCKTVLVIFVKLDI